MRIVLLIMLTILGSIGVPGQTASPTPELYLYSIGASPDGKLMAMTTSSGLRVYDVSAAKLVYTIHEQRENSWDATYEDVSWSPDGTVLATNKTYRRGVRIWDTKTWEILADKSPDTTLNDYDEPGFFWSPDGQQLAVGMGRESGRILIWDKTSRTWAKPIEYKGAQVSIVWTTENQILVLGEGITGLHDAVTGKLVRPLSTGIDGATGYAIWSPDTRLAYLYFDLGGVLIDSTTDKSAGFRAYYRAPVAWSMDGRYFAAVSNEMTGENSNEIWIWDTQTRKVLMHENQGDVVNTLTWLPNHDLLVAGTLNGHQTLWNATAKQVLFELTEVF